MKGMILKRQQYNISACHNISCSEGLHIRCSCVSKRNWPTDLGISIYL